MLRIFLIISLVFCLSIVPSVRPVYATCGTCGVSAPATSSDGEKEKEKGQPTGITASEVSVEELKTFARAFMNVQADLEDEESMEESGAAIYEKTTSIVRQEGLTVKRYNQLSMLMNEDPDFKKAVEKMIETIKEEEKEDK